VLLGELAEVSIFGLLTLKTRVETQEERQAEVEKQLAEIRISTSQNQSFALHLGDGSYQNPKAVSESAQAKVGSVTPHASTPGDAEPVEMAALKYRLIEAYEGLNPFILIAENVSRGQAPEQYWRRLPVAYRSVIEHLSPADLNGLIEWRDRFKREIDSVRSVRNSVAHPPALVLEDDLLATLDTVETLARELARLGLR